MKTWLLISCRRRHWQGCVGSSPPVHLLHHTWEHGRRFAGRRPSLHRKLVTRRTEETGGAYRGWSRPLPLYVDAEARGDSRKAVPADPSLLHVPYYAGLKAQIKLGFTSVMYLQRKQIQGCLRRFWQAWVKGLEHTILGKISIFPQLPLPLIPSISPSFTKQVVKESCGE